MSEVIEFPKTEAPEWHMQFAEPDRVIIEGRMIPNLRAKTEGEEVAIIVDGRMSINVPKALGYDVAWLVANALAIGAGYSHLGAESKYGPFAPQCARLGPGGTP